jgi:hypothetical protein
MSSECVAYTSITSGSSSLSRRTARRKLGSTESRNGFRRGPFSLPGYLYRAHPQRRTHPEHPVHVPLPPTAVTSESSRARPHGPLHSLAWTFRAGACTPGMLLHFFTCAPTFSAPRLTGGLAKEKTFWNRLTRGFGRARPIRGVRAGTARYPRVEAVLLQTLPTGNSNSSSDSGFISMLYPGISGGM